MPHDLPPGMSQPAHRSLAGAGIKNLDDVARRSRSELSALHGMGPKAIRILGEALRKHGMNFAAKNTANG